MVVRTCGGVTECGRGFMGRACGSGRQTDGDLEDVPVEFPPLPPLPEDVTLAKEVVSAPSSARSDECASLLRHCPDGLTQCPEALSRCPDTSHLVPKSAADLCSSRYGARLEACCNARVAAMSALAVAFVLVVVCALISSARGTFMPLIASTTTTTTSTSMTSTVTLTDTTNTATTTTTDTSVARSCNDTPGWPCLGALNLSGHGLIHLISAGANSPNEKIGATGVDHCSQVTPYKQGRVYFGESCSRATWSNSDYAAINFLGKVVRFSVDLSSAHCGCVAAFYLVNMRQNTDPGRCNGDFYCDSNRVCGVACAEIDLMEANRNMYKVTLHNSTDTDGKHATFDEKYGPGNKCINTERAFNVSAAISYDGSSVTIILAQGACAVEKTIMYPAMSVPLWAGMTPVISYWYNDKPGSMKWFDGKVCQTYDPKHACGEQVRLSNFSLSSTPVYWTDESYSV